MYPPVPPLVLGLATSLLACTTPAEVRPAPETRPMASASSRTAAPRPAAPAPVPVDPGPPPRLRISEIMTDPLLIDDAAGEYVEVVNLSDGPVRLADLALLLPSGKTVSPERPSMPLLAAGGVLVATPLGAGPAEAKVRGMRLPNAAGRVELLWRGKQVDVAQWHRKWPWPKAMAGRALERTAPGADGLAGGSWRRSRETLRGIERGSPGRLTWSCEVLAREGIGSLSACSKLERGQKRPNRTPRCPVREEVAGGGLEPST